MKNYFNTIFGQKFSIKRKISVVYFFMAVLPIIIITVLASVIYYRSILKGAYSLVEQNAIQHEIVVSERMESYENVLYDLIVDKEFIQLAKKVKLGDETSLLIDEAHLEAMLRRSVYTHDGIRDISFLSDSGGVVSYSRWYGTLNEMIWSDQEKRKDIYNSIEQEQRLSFIAAVNLSRAKGRADYVILMGYPVKNLRTQEQSGVLVMALDDDILLFDESKTQSNDGVTSVILDDNERIIAGVDTEHINRNYQEYLKTEYGGIKKITENRRKIEGTEWTIINIIDTDIYKSEIYYFVKVVFLIMITITCFFFFIAYFATRKYINSIQNIAQNINNYEGTDANRISIDMNEKDELYVIVRQFNKMTARVDALVDMLKQRNKEIKASVISQKHAEIKALEAQINPHFLFNTLDSINWRAIEHGEEEISDMLGALGSLLRYSVSNIEMEVLLEAEISWLKKYIFLQRDRFNNSFDCEYDISKEALEFPIYKMLLQPIIENAIIHAFEEVKEGGMISIKAFVCDDYKLEIRIKDNGCGMEEDKLTEVRKEIVQNTPLSSKSIGIGNMIHRLRIYYREGAEIVVNSKTGEGTEFILRIENSQMRGVDTD